VRDMVGSAPAPRLRDRCVVAQHFHKPLVVSGDRLLRDERTVTTACLWRCFVTFDIDQAVWSGCETDSENPPESACPQMVTIDIFDGDMITDADWSQNI
jgi:hypothetical protein